MAFLRPTFKVLASTHTSHVMGCKYERRSSSRDAATLVCGTCPCHLAPTFPPCATVLVPSNQRPRWEDPRLRFLWINKSPHTNLAKIQLQSILSLLISPLVLLRRLTSSLRVLRFAPQISRLALRWLYLAPSPPREHPAVIGADREVLLSLANRRARPASTAGTAGCHLWD